MNRTTGLLIVGALLLLAGVGYFRPDLFPGIDAPKLAWLLMALLLVSGAGWGFRRFRHDGGRALTGLLVWAAAFIAVAGAYQLLR
ncbi:MAG: hypothetical protein ABL883_00180 [Terricaulis sp.]